jgi:hypothetical protein
LPSLPATPIALSSDANGLAREPSPLVSLPAGDTNTPNASCTTHASSVGVFAGSQFAGGAPAEPPDALLPPELDALLPPELDALLPPELDALLPPSPPEALEPPTPGGPALVPPLLEPHAALAHAASNVETAQSVRVRMKGAPQLGGGYGWQRVSVTAPVSAAESEIWFDIT